MVFFAGILLPYPDAGVTLGIEIFVIFLLAFFEGIRLFLGRCKLRGCSMAMTLATEEKVSCLLK